MKTIFSGIQPTGDIQLGNYIGAVNNWVSLQSDDVNNIYSIVDLHAITIFKDPKELRENILKLASCIIACGIDPEKSILFAQSSNEDHAELSWILNCVARLGWLNRMTQFKDKAGKNRENSSAGLYIYPVLQAADILLYDADLVPVGEDQKQHIELTRDIAEKFNRDFSCEAFKLPEPMIVKETARIMSLKDGTKKMSKSDPSEYSKIMLSDSDEDILNKIKKSKTDSLPFPVIGEDLSERPEINNLLNIYSFCSKTSRESIMTEYEGKGFAEFKSNLAERVVNIISPIRNKQVDLFKNQDYLLSILKKGSIKSKDISSKKIKVVKEAVGFINFK